MNQTLQQLKDYIQLMNRYDRVANLLMWDIETICPRNGVEGHSDAYTYFSTESFKIANSPEMKQVLDTLMEEDNYHQLDDKWQFVVKKMKEDLDRLSRIPSDFYEEFISSRTESMTAWRDAKNQNDFSLFAPHLEKMISLSKQMMSYTDPDLDVYNALLNQYEKGMDEDTYDRLFNELKEGLKPLMTIIKNNQKPRSDKFKRYCSIDDQQRLEKYLLKYIGFSFESGTVAQTEHPFTSSFSSKDVRVTNHFKDHDPISAMFTTIHEGGHAIFDQNVNPDYDGTVAGSCEYMGIHESQSRFYENILGRRYTFWKPIFEDIKKIIPDYQDVTLDEFVEEINHVEPGFIRCDSDEVTYCYHIIIRYEIEKMIFKGDVKVEDLPGIWNQKMKEYLGLDVENDALGILQDIHWSDADFGYFPSYLLGSIYDGMYIEAIEKDLGSIDECLESGRILDITHWLNTHIHVYGNTRTPREVIENVCHKDVSAKPLLDYFYHKYQK